MTRRFNDDVPASVFWVRESLLYPCRAELYVVGRRTHSGAATPYTKQPSCQQTAHYFEVNSRVPLTTSRFCFWVFRKRLKFPHILHSVFFREGRRRWSTRQPSLEQPGSGIRLLWHPRHFEGGDFFQKTYNNLRNLLVIIDWQHRGTRGFGLVSEFTRRRWIRENCFTIGNCFETHDTESTENWPVKREGWVSANWLS